MNISKKVSQLFSLGAKLLLALTLMFSLNISQAWGASQDCTAFGDSSMICAPISNIAVTLDDGTAVPISNGSATIANSVSSLKFVFTSSSIDASKNIHLQFFDISSGLSISLPSDKCSSAQLASNACVATVDSNGSVTIPVTLSGMSTGKVFKYQLTGPAGFTSGFVTATYSSTGKAGYTPEACFSDSTTICAPITRLTMKSSNTDVPVTYDASTNDGTANVPLTTSNLDYKFTFPVDYTNKYVFVQFFDIVHMRLTIPAGSINSSTSCDPQPAANSGCKIQIDSNGSATFRANFTSITTGASFKYKIAGPNYGSNVVVITLGTVPSATPSASPSASRSATPSASPSASRSATPSPTPSATLTSDHTSLPIGSTTVFTYSITGATSGTVTFTYGPTKIGSVAVSSGQATKSYTWTSLGTYAVVATFTKTGTTINVPSNQVSIAVNQASTSVGIQLSKSKVVINKSVNVTATVSVVTPGKTSVTDGTITIYDGTTIIAANVTVASNKKAVFSWTPTTLGSHNLTAVFTGGVTTTSSTSSLLLVNVVAK